MGHKLRAIAATLCSPAHARWVKAAILNEPALKVSEIAVETFKGAVQLNGFVDSQAAATTAVSVTRAVGGVKSVKNDMRVK
jgi:osmotically-inducible protein OsmY